MDPTEEAFGRSIYSTSDTRKAQRSEPRCEASIKPRRDDEKRSQIFMESRMFDFGNNVNVAWCLCGYCVPMSTHIEFVCCLEKAGLPDRADS